MSKSLEIRKMRCSDVLKQFLEGSREVIFLTLTTRDVVDIVEIRSRWRSFRHWLVEHFSGIRYIMNYEVHPKGHGWHIHGVFTRYIPLSGYLSTIQSYGFGRVNVKRVNDVFVAEYLSKHCMKAYRGVPRGTSKRIRLLNQSRGLPVLSDYKYRSEFLDHVRKIFMSVRSQSPFFSSRIRAYWSSLPFRARFKLCELAVLFDVSEFAFDLFLRDILDRVPRVTPIGFSYYKNKFFSYGTSVKKYGIILRKKER